MRAVADFLPDLWPGCHSDLMEGICRTYDEATAKFGIVSDNHHIHFLTQCSAETGGGVIVVENMNYTHADQIRRTWPSRFRAMSDADIQANYVRNARALADLVYGARMGNEDDGTDDDDGYDHRGMGLLQTTGKDAHRLLGVACGLDLIGTPALMFAPDTAIVCAAADFAVICKCLDYADADNLVAVSSLVNVGHVVNDTSKINGWAARASWYDKVRAAING